MGQIVFNGQKPKCANKLAITTGTMADEVLDENEIWLIDSTVDSVSSTDAKSNTGTGKYDKYIKGDGQTAAKNLQLRNIDEAGNIPTKLSQLEDDTTHRLVTDEDKQRWNNASAGEGSVAVESSDDIKVVIDESTNLTHLEFADKNYDMENNSGLGRKILRKNPITTFKKVRTVVYDSLKNDAQGDTYTSEFTRVKRQYINSVKGYDESSIGETIIGKTIDLTPGSRSSCSYCTKHVYAGETYKIDAQKSDAAGFAWSSRFWIITGEPYTVEVDGVEKTVADVLQAYKPNYEDYLNAIVQETAYVDVEQDGVLWVNYISYNRGTCIIEKISNTNESITINSITGITDANTEYTVQYDYDLNCGVLELPENTILNFAGGSIKNGYIKGNNSMIVASSGANIMEGGNIFGSWKNTEFYPKWFGAAADSVTDDTEVLQTMLDLSANIRKAVKLMWYGYSFKTTHSLYLKSNTYIYGGTITAVFENPLDWILQTFTIYYNSSADLSAQVGYKYIASWQEFDGGSGDSINHITESYIDGLTLIGTLNKHMVIPEGGDETSEKVWDGTYCPIYGGLKINGAPCPTNNVTIRNVAIGMARGACLHSYDSYLTINARFLAYAARAINTTTVSNSYLNAWCNYFDPNNTSTYTPYYVEYQGFNAQPGLGNSWREMLQYIEGTGGYDDGEASDSGLIKPKLCSVKANYANLTFINSITDSGAEVGFAVTNSILVLEHPYFEGVRKCYIYAALTRVSVNMPDVYTDAAYDFIGNQVSFVLNNCSGKIDGSGGSNGTYHKYYIVSSQVNVLNTKGSNYPNDDRFYFLPSSDGSTMAIASASGESLTAEINKFYKFSSAVNTLAVTLPAMNVATSVSGICLSFTTGDTPSITFTSADSKTISYFNTYPENFDLNSEYEINCMFNGTKWVIAAATIE